MVDQTIDEGSLVSFAMLASDPDLATDPVLALDAPAALGRRVGDDIRSGARGKDLQIRGLRIDALRSGPGEDALIDWNSDRHCHGPRNGAGHHAKVTPCAAWVKSFVIDLAGDNGTHNPNGDIKILAPKEDHDLTLTRMASVKRR
jgi:hypothetical protein